MAARIGLLLETQIEADGDPAWILRRSNELLGVRVGADVDGAIPAITPLFQNRPAASEVRVNSTLPLTDQSRGSDRAHSRRNEPSFELDVNASEPTGKDQAGATVSVKP